MPVFLSLVAEPVTGLVDTAFVSRLGAAPLAALGVGAIALSGVFWVFNFLGVTTQTEVARGLGLGGARPGDAQEAVGLALRLALLLGAVTLVVGWPLADTVAGLLGAEGTARVGAVVYIERRLLGAPAVVVTLVAFGALRGLHDMRTPLAVAVGVNALNVLLDALLIPGAGPVPGLGIAGAAWASTIAQWLGAATAVAAVRARLGPGSRPVGWERLPALLGAGRDLILRTLLLTFFLLVATRSANRAGVESGAAHQAIRQVWMLAALALDAWAASAQSLAGYFLAGGRLGTAKRLAAIVCGWSVATGFAIAALMLWLEGLAAGLLVAPTARAVFPTAWRLAAWFQPLNALAFATDGLHWGAREYAYLRNAVGVATLVGLAALVALDEAGGGTLSGVWLATGGWVVVRACFGVGRIWPGKGAWDGEAGSPKRASSRGPGSRSRGHRGRNRSSRQ